MRRKPAPVNDLLGARTGISSRIRGAVLQDNDPALSPPVHNHLAASALTVTVFPYAGEFLCLLFLMTTPAAR